MIKEKNKSHILAVAGGKGGTGKSFIISAVSYSLAKKNKKVILVDADFGGANLHSLLGVKPKLSLTDFFENKTPLENLLIDSGIENLKLIAGNIGSLTGDNIKYSEKQKLFRHIKKLDCDYTLVDLGAGTHFNTIDTFLLADKMIVVIVPEITAIENMYYFLKNVFYRKLLKSLSVEDLKEEAQNIWKNKNQYGIKNLRQLIDYMSEVSKTVGYIINSELTKFKINIIVNQVKTEREVILGSSVKSVCKKYFGFNALYVGNVDYDEEISACIKKKQMYLQTNPTSRCAQQIELITENLVN